MPYTGHGLVGTTHAGDVETLVNRIVEQGLPPYLLTEIDLLVFPARDGDERYVSEVVELVSESADRHYGSERAGTIHKGGTTIHWNTVAYRDHDGDFHFAYDHPVLGDDERRVDTTVFERLADRTDRSVDEIERRFHRRHRYVRYLVQEGVDDADELFSVIADLETNEAATVERLRHRTGDGEEGSDGRD